MAGRVGLDKRSVVEAAAKMADERGLQRVTLSALADSLDVRTPSLYHYIDGSDGLRRELALYGLRGLGMGLQWAAVGKETDQAIEAMFLSYRAFAREHPGVYEVTLRAPDPLDEELRSASQRVVDTVLAVLEPYRLSPDDAIHVVRSFRATAHGFVALEAAGAFGLPLSPEQSYRRLIAVFLNGLRMLE